MERLVEELRRKKSAARLRKGQGSMRLLLLQRSGSLVAAAVGRAEDLQARQ